MLETESQILPGELYPLFLLGSLETDRRFNELTHLEFETVIVFGTKRSEPRNAMTLSPASLNISILISVPRNE